VPPSPWPTPLAWKPWWRRWSIGGTGAGSTTAGVIWCCDSTRLARFGRSRYARSAGTGYLSSPMRRPHGSGLSRCCVRTGGGLSGPGHRSASAGRLRVGPLAWCAAPNGTALAPGLARTNHEKYQERRRRDFERAAEHLNPSDRAAYDERQRRIDAAGRDAWEPGKEADAAALCELTVGEFREMQDLKRIPWQQRTPNQQDRLDQLERDGVLPPLLAQQALVVAPRRRRHLQPGHRRRPGLVRRPHRRAEQPGGHQRVNRSRASTAAASTRGWPGAGGGTWLAVRRRFARGRPGGSGVASVTEAWTAAGRPVTVRLWSPQAENYLNAQVNWQIWAKR
jgi:hypothetical protein